MTLPIPRRHIPMRLQRDVALLMLGLDPATAQLDHYPALGLRPVNAALGDYDPPQLDPRYLRWRAKVEHKVKTFGTKATTAGSDIHLIAKAKRVTAQQLEFRRRLLAKSEGQRAIQKSQWPKRQFQRRSNRATFAAQSQDQS